MSRDLWIGAILSIPIGILTGLATPWFQKQFDNWNKGKLIKNQKTAQLEYEKIKSYQANKNELTHYYLTVVIKTTFISAFVAVFSGILFLFGQFLERANFDYSQGISIILYGLGQFCALVGSLLIVNICRPAINTWTRLRNFDQ